MAAVITVLGLAAAHGDRGGGSLSTWRGERRRRAGHARPVRTENLYEASRVKRFFAINISSFPTFQEGSRERSSALMARQALCLAALSRSTPGARRGRAGRREGLTAKARAELQWSPGQYAANVTAFSVDPSFLVDVPITFVQLTPRRSPFRYAALATSPYIRSGRSPYQDPSCSSARAQGSKVGWDPSKPRHIAARVFADHTSTLESVMFLLSSLSVSLITPSEQRLQAPDLSRDSARAQISSLRATATIVIRRMRPLSLPTRSRNQTLKGLSG